MVFKHLETQTWRCQPGWQGGDSLSFQQRLWLANALLLLTPPVVTPPPPPPLTWTLPGFSLVTNGLSLVLARAVGLGAPGHPTGQPPWYQARRAQRKGRGMERRMLEWQRELAKCGSAAAGEASPGGGGGPGRCPRAPAPPAERRAGCARGSVSGQRPWSRDEVRPAPLQPTVLLGSCQEGGLPLATGAQRPQGCAVQAASPRPCQGFRRRCQPSVGRPSGHGADGAGVLRLQGLLPLHLFGNPPFNPYQVQLAVKLASR